MDIAAAGIAPETGEKGRGADPEGFARGFFREFAFGGLNFPEALSIMIRSGVLCRIQHVNEQNGVLDT